MNEKKLGNEENVAGQKKDASTEAFERFKVRVEEKVKESQPRELMFEKRFPIIGATFKIAFTTKRGLPAEAEIELVYVNEGKGRMTFEFTHGRTE